MDALAVSVAVPNPPLIEVGLMPTVRPVVPVAESDTVPVKWLIGETVMVEDPWVPEFVLMLAGFELIE